MLFRSRRLLEYYKRENVKLEFEDIKDLTEEARGYFKESRRLNSKNIYAYISEIQIGRASCRERV